VKAVIAAGNFCDRLAQLYQRDRLARALRAEFQYDWPSVGVCWTDMGACVSAAWFEPLGKKRASFAVADAKDENARCW
jgi:hypothetical protein